MLSALTRDLSGNREAGTPSYLVPEAVALCFGFLKLNFLLLSLAVLGHHCCVGFSLVAARRALEKTPGSKYSSTSGLSPRGHLERQAEFHASTQDEA